MASQRLPAQLAPLCRVLCACLIAAAFGACGSTRATPTRRTSAPVATKTTPPAVPTRSIPAVPLQSLYPSLANLDSVQSLVIQESWDGLSMTAPHKSRYSLTKEAGHFIGAATFAIGGTSSRQANRDLTIPEALVRTFVEELASMNVTDAPYSPLRDHSDDYPSIQIDITIGGDTLSVYTESQGDFHTPWGISFQGHASSSTTATIQNALDTLKPALHAETLQELISAYNRDDKATRAAKAAIPSPIAMPCQPRSGTPPPLTLPGAPPGRAIAPTPQLVLGQTINLAEYLGLRQAQSVRLTGIGMDGAQYGLRTYYDSTQLRSVIDALNQPATVVTTATGADRLIEVRSITLVFGLGATNVAITYNPQRQTIEWPAAQPQFTVNAPPDFLDALATVVCKP